MIALVVYDLTGSEVRTLVREKQKAQYYNVLWNCLNNNGQFAASGRYLLKMTAPGFTETITIPTKSSSSATKSSSSATTKSPNSGKRRTTSRNKVL